MGRFVMVAVVAAVALVAAGCSVGRSTTAASPTVPTVAPTLPRVSPALSPTAPARSSPAAGPSPSPAFHGGVASIDAAGRASMIASSVWRPGCPVAIEDLRLLTVDYWGFDGLVHRGKLVVNEDASTAVLTAIRLLFAARFPIHRMVLVDAYGGDDDRSMAADNTSAFNCRGVPGGSAWSEHAYGRAVDLNPVENPEVRNGVVSPPRGSPFTDRSLPATGMIHPGDAAVRAFAAVGWRWGGFWHSLKDYQHFSWNGL